MACSSCGGSCPPGGCNVGGCKGGNCPVRRPASATANKSSSASSNSLAQLVALLKKSGIA